MNDQTSTLKLLTDRSHDLSRRRDRALATGNWYKAIQLEARLEEVEEIKKALVREEENVKDLTNAI